MDTLLNYIIILIINITKHYTIILIITTSKCHHCVLSLYLYVCVTVLQGPLAYFWCLVRDELSWGVVINALPMGGPSKYPPIGGAPIAAGT